MKRAPNPKPEPDDLWRCAEALEEIAHSLTRIADLLEDCGYTLSREDGTKAIRTVPLTD